MDVVLVDGVPLSKSTVISVLMAQGKSSQEALLIADFTFKVASGDEIVEKEVADFLKVLIKTDIEIFSHTVDTEHQSIRHLKLSTNFRPQSKSKRHKPKEKA